MNLIGIMPYDRKTYDKEMENVLKKRLLGFDRGNSYLRKQSSYSGQSNNNNLTSYTGSPIKVLNGNIQYSQDKRMNFILN